jgi:hypothetical protein
LLLVRPRLLLLLLQFLLILLLYYLQALSFPTARAASGEKSVN